MALRKISTDRNYYVDENGKAHDHVRILSEADYRALLRVAKAAEKMREKMESIIASDEYFAVWQSARLHRGPYQGDKWEAEAAALDRALKPLRRKP